MSVYLYLCLLETLVTGVLILILCLGGAPLHTILKVVDTKYSKPFTDFMYTEIVIRNGFHHKFYRHLVVGNPPAMHWPIVCNLKNKAMKFKVHTSEMWIILNEEPILLKNPANSFLICPDVLRYENATLKVS